MRRSRSATRVSLAALLCGAVLIVGCANFWPKIDPSGRRLFIWPNDYPPQYQEVPGRVTRRHESGVQINPSRAIAPVGSEVVLTAGVCGKDGHLTAHERVEWSIPPRSVGQFVAVGNHRGIDWLGSRTKPQKVDNTFAIGATSGENFKLTRGTPTPDDDVPILRGQAWVTVTSPVEGTTYVTAFAPDAYTWDQRTNTAQIYWIDGHWTLPPPASQTAGRPHTLTSTVIRATNHRPQAGWRVRYEVVGGPPAGFASPGSTSLSPAIEVLTNELGQASANLQQAGLVPGANDVRVSVIRPAEVAEDGLNLTVAQGMTRVTWGATGLTATKQGPTQVGVGQPATYVIDIRNTSNQTAKGIVVSDQLASDVQFVRSDPPTAPVQQVLQWNLGDMVAGESRRVQVVLVPTRPGTLNNIATIRTADGTTIQAVATTSVTIPELRLDLNGPAEAVVGSRVSYTIQVSNQSGGRASGLVLVNRFDPGLRHESLPSPIERQLPDLGPGESQQIGVTFEVVAPGQACQVVEIVSSVDNTLRASARKCLTATPPPPVTTPPIATPPVVPVPVTPPIPTTPATPTPPAPPPAAGPRPQLTVKKSGPDRKRVGELATFTIDVTNNGPGPATLLKVADNYDQSMAAENATNGFRRVNADLIWIVDQLPAGRTIRFEVLCRCRQRTQQACNRVTVTCQEESRADGEACLEIQGAAAPLEVTLADLNDPVAINNTCLYEITVRNQSSESDSQIRVSLTLPLEMTPLAEGTQAPGSMRFAFDGQTVRFEPVVELRAGEKLTFRVRALARAMGKVKAQAEVSSTNQSMPLAAETTTDIH